MGMYDLLACGFPLPGNPPAWVVGHEFQTKDLHNMLELCTITPDGMLIIRREKSRWADGKDVPVSQWDERVMYHGDITFYTSGDMPDGTHHGERVWLEYCARFSNGLLDWIALKKAAGIEEMQAYDHAQVVWRDRTLDEVGITDWASYGITEEIAAAYLDSLNRHIAAVREAGLKLDVPLEQLNIHDQSKFGLDEFPFYARNFFGDKGDPDGWARAWLHHIHANPHHWNHWLFADSFTPKGSTVEGGAVPMPHKYIREMVADWMGAGFAYTGSWDMTKWLTENLPRIRLHSQTAREVGEILTWLGYDVEKVWPKEATDKGA